MGWTTIKPALISLFGELAKEKPLPFKAEWLERARLQMSDKHQFQLFLQVTDVKVLGTDELRYDVVESEDDDEPDTVTEFVSGQRQFILRVEVHTLEDSDEVHALHTLSSIQTRLRRSRSLKALEAVDIAIAKIGSAQDTTYKHQGRKVPRATMDVWFNAAANEDDPIPIGVIEHVEWTRDVADLPPPHTEITPPLEP